jgi:hypothetical protein
MADNKITFKERNFSRGIDQRSAETDIEPGFVEDALNVDVVQGRLQKRKGYERYATLPLRVESITYTLGSPGTITLTLPSSISLTQPATLQPITVVGSSSNTSETDVDFTSSFTSQVYTTYSFPSANTILLTNQNGSVTTNQSNLSCNIVIFGLEDEVSYTTGTSPGYVHHIDSYRSLGDNRIIAGVGGSLYSIDESSSASSFNINMNIPSTSSFKRTVTSTLFTNSGGFLLINYGVAAPADGTPVWLVPVASGALPSNLVEEQIYYTASGGGNTFYLSTTRSAGVAGTPKITYATGASGDIVVYRADQIIGPAFWDTGEEPTLSRGCITFDDGGSHAATITSFGWSSGTSSVYTLSIPNYKILDNTNTDVTGSYPGVPGTLSDRIRPNFDYLTVTGMHHSDLNGTFLITSVSITGSGTSATLQLTVTNGSVTDARYNDSVTSGLNTAGVGAIYTDRITNNTATTLVANDYILQYCSSISATTQFDLNSLLKVDSVDTSAPNYYTYVSGITSSYGLNSSNTFLGQRTGTVFNVSASGSPSPISYYYVGKTITIDGTDYRHYITAVDLVNNKITIDSEATYTPVEGGGSNPVFPITISAINPPLLSGSDSSTYPIYRYTNKYSYFNTRYLTSSSYVGQTPVKSCMASDNMYFTNYNDAVLKYDGTNISSAGIPPWQMQAFVTIDSSGSSGEISINTNSLAYDSSTSAPNAFQITVTATDISRVRAFSPGDKIVSSVNYFNILTVKEVSVDETNGIGRIYTVEPIVGGAGAGTIYQLSIYQYYFLLRQVDVNNNVIISPAMGYGDYTLYLYENAKVNFKFIGIPPMPIIDGASMRLEIYRTKAATNEPLSVFYLVGSIPIDHSILSGYIEFTDTQSDIMLTTLDTTSVALKGTELPTSINIPQRAKYITSVDNKLILGNLIGYPKLTLSCISSTYSATYLKNYIVAISKATLGSLPVALDMNSFVACQFTDTATNSITLTNSYSYNRSVGNFFSISGFNAGDNKYYTLSCTKHGLITGDRIQFYSDGTNPAYDPISVVIVNLQVNTDYYVIRVDANTIKLASSYANALANSDIGALFSKATGADLSLMIRYMDGFLVEEAGVTVDGFADGRWVYLYQSSTDTSLAYSGWYQVASNEVGGDHTIYFRQKNSKAVYYTATTEVDRLLYSANSYSLPVPCNAAGAIDYNYSQSLFNIVTSEKLSNWIKLSHAINASMSNTDIQISGQETFRPWIAAFSGNYYPVETLELISYTPSLLTNSSFHIYMSAPLTTSIFVNGYLESYISSGSSVLSITDSPVSYEAVFPSRILQSYQNFPEIFDNIEVQEENNSDSVIDVNSADGQQITGLLPFFADTAFGGAQKGSIVTVFKENSIYLVDLASKDSGIQNKHKINSHGIGCTFPASIAASKDAIFFANSTGLFAIRPDLSVQYVGKYIERLWKNTVDNSYTDFAAGHHDDITQRYLLSVTAVGDTENDMALAYHHVEETQDKLGAWTRYDNVPSIGWANLDGNEYFAGVDRALYRTRRVGEIYDYQDDGAAISAEITLRALDFGDTSLRKLVRQATGIYRVPSQVNSISLSVARNLDTSFESCQAFSIDKVTNLNNLSDYGTKKVRTIVHNLPQERGTFFQLKLVANGLNETIDLIGYDFRVGALTDAGNYSAGDTTLG